MTRVLVSLGSNIAPYHHMRKAQAQLEERFSVVRHSGLYQTEAVGALGQDAFLNGASLIETMLAPAQLKRILGEIEEELGRRRTVDKYAARTIDLDITLYGSCILELGSRRIPDPELLIYGYIALPAADVAPKMIHPETGEALLAIAARLESFDIKRQHNDATHVATTKGQS